MRGYKVREWTMDIIGVTLRNDFHLEVLLRWDMIGLVLEDHQGSIWEDLRILDLDLIVRGVRIFRDLISIKLEDLIGDLFRIRGKDLQKYDYRHIASLQSLVVLESVICCLLVIGDLERFVNIKMRGVYREEEERAYQSKYSSVLRTEKRFFGVELWLKGLCCKTEKERMSQGNLLRSGLVVESPKRLKITVPRFDNSKIIRRYAKTLIGRCLNPSKQDMKALLFMMPKIWKLEERVRGCDLGRGRFQFDFETEEDINEVLSMEPFHFDYWMISLVRWEPSMDAYYPTKIKFWVWVVDLPLQWWDERTFSLIGQGLGEVVENGVDLRFGRVRVWIDGFKPLTFEVDLTDYTGEETVVSLRYEKLFGYCRRCNRLCHDLEICPLIRKQQVALKEQGEEGRGQQYRGPRSYKGALEYGKTEGLVEKGKEKGSSMVHYGDGGGNRGRRNNYTWARKAESKYGGSRDGGESGKHTVTGGESMAAVPLGENKLKRPAEEELSDPTRIMLEAFHGKELEGDSHQKEMSNGSPALLGNAEEDTNVLSGVPTGKMLGGEVEKEMISGPKCDEAAISAEALEQNLLEDDDLLEGLEDEVLNTDFDDDQRAFEEELLEMEAMEEVLKKEGVHEGKRGGARRNLFQQRGAVGGTTKKRIMHSLLSPRKGVNGKGKAKEGRLQEGRGVTDASRSRGADGKG